MDEEFKRQIQGLAKIIDDLDYYQILKLDQIAFDEDIKKAYFRESRIYHPDKFYNEPLEIKEQVNKVFKRILEAYKVLMDKDRRAMYTRNINGPERKKYLRFDLRQLTQEKEKKEDEGQTPMGKKYYLMAKSALQNKDYKGAKINLQLAAKMEPNNQTFREKLTEIEDILKKRRGL
jgi:DnaJ-class molecular chaperone